MFRRNFTISWIVLEIVGILCAVHAHAGSVAEALANQSLAYNEFYKACRASDNLSSPEVKRLAGNIISPAESNLAYAIHTETKHTLMNSGLQFANASDLPASTAITPQYTWNSHPGGSSYTSNARYLDQKGIPKLVDFPGTARR